MPWHRVGCFAWLVVVLTATLVRGDDRPAADNLRVMSFNIRYGTAKDGDNHWDRRKEFLVETIQAFDPDLLGTQETLGFQRDYLAKQLSGYEVLGVGRTDGREDGEMMALYFKRERFKKLDGGHFWLSETPATVGSKSWDSSLPRMVTWVKLADARDADGPPIAFFNTHFDHQGKTARLESARLLRRQVATIGKGCAVVVTGDFNTDEGSDPYRALFQAVDQQDSPIVDTYRVAHPDREPMEGTFSSFRSDETKGPRIDWIGASRDWQVVTATIDRTAREGRTPSDHFPINAVLRRLKVARPNDPQDPPADAPELVFGGPFEVENILNVVYTDGEKEDAGKHQLDLFLPKGQKDFPVVFFIHGGAWVSGDRKLYGMFGHTFAKNGIGTVVISYRLSPKVQHPAHIQDVARAFAWTHRHIGEYGGRADQIFVTGQSAGGHLAALLATNEDYLRAEGLALKDIKGALPISGIYTFRAGRADFVIGKGEEAANSASPIKQVTGKEPPFLILYADRDFGGCRAMSQELCRQLDAKQVAAEVKEIKDRNHISIMFRLMWSDSDATAQELLKFVARHTELKLAPRTANADKD